MTTPNLEKHKKALQNVASGHIDDAVTPDDFENFIRPPLELKTLHSEEADTTTTIEQTPDKTDTTKQIPEQAVVTTKPTPTPKHDFEDDFRDPYWNWLLITL